MLRLALCLTALVAVASAACPSACSTPQTVSACATSCWVTDKSCLCRARDPAKNIDAWCRGYKGYCDVTADYPNGETPWSYALRQAGLMNTTVEDGLSLKQCPDNAEGATSEIPYNGVTYFGEENVIKTTSLTASERMVQPATFTVPTVQCPMKNRDIVDDCCRKDDTQSSDIACCSENYQKYGGCPAVKAQSPISDYTYNYNTPSLGDNINNGQDNEIPFGFPYRNVPRQMHGKGAACLEADFTIEENLPARYAQGIFASGGKTFKSIVRMSGNKNATVKDVHDPRVRGFLVKVLGIEPETYGTTITLSNVCQNNMGPLAAEYFGNHILKWSDTANLNTIDFLNIAVRRVAGAPVGVRNNFVVADSLDYSPAFLNAQGPTGRGQSLTMAEKTQVHFTPLHYSYGSAAAHRWGPQGAGKYNFRPCPGEVEKVESVDFSHDLSIADLMFFNTHKALDRKSHEAVDDFKFCMYVQLQDDPCNEPVEDSVKEWTSPEQLVATVTLKKQDVAYDGWCENLNAQPFRQLPEFFPIGSIQRIRSSLYSYTVLYRHNINCKNGLNLCDEADVNKKPKPVPGRDYPSAEFYLPQRNSTNKLLQETTDFESSEAFTSNHCPGEQGTPAEGCAADGKDEL